MVMAAGEEGARAMAIDQPQICVRPKQKRSLLGRGDRWGFEANLGPGLALARGFRIMCYVQDCQGSKIGSRMGKELTEEGQLTH
mmetsp:Transcript_68210/g.142546  ORF Transcript_68210/g.142546 Transcript_68210/m.142546 type:complete len:84 (+) Transcript_68210:1522-1773(+)